MSYLEEIRTKHIGGSTVCLKLEQPTLCLVHHGRQASVKIRNDGAEFDVTKSSFYFFMSKGFVYMMAHKKLPNNDYSYGRFSDGTYDLECGFEGIMNQWISFVPSSSTWEVIVNHIDATGEATVEGYLETYGCDTGVNLRGENTIVLIDEGIFLGETLYWRKKGPAALNVDFYMIHQ